MEKLKTHKEANGLQWKIILSNLIGLTVVSFFLSLAHKSVANKSF